MAEASRTIKQFTSEVVTLEEEAREASIPPLKQEVRLVQQVRRPKIRGIYHRDYHKVN
jgi:hypothetical protein